MYAIGLTVSYLKDQELVQSQIDGWQIHSTFDEIYLTNGDVIVDQQIIEVIE